jgi:hypothetical protein
MAGYSRSCVGRRGLFICVGLRLFACKHGVHNELLEGQAGWQGGLVVVVRSGGEELFMIIGFPRSQGSSIPSPDLSNQLPSFPLW